MTTIFLSGISTNASSSGFASLKKQIRYEKNFAFRLLYVVNHTAGGQEDESYYRLRPID